MTLIFSSILLGFGGLDPMGGILIMTALAHGVKKKQVYLFALISLLSTIMFGTLFSYSASLGLNYFSNIFKYIPDMAYVVISLLVAVGCFYWVINSTFQKEKKEVREEKKESKFINFAKKNMPLTGFFFAFWAMSDPTFWTVVALATREGNLLLTILSSGIWMVLGQMPLYILTISLIFNIHEKLIEKVNIFLNKNNRRKRLSNFTKTLIYFIVLGIGIYFLSSSLVYLIKGVWLF